MFARSVREVSQQQNDLELSRNSSTSGKLRLVQCMSKTCLPSSHHVLRRCVAQLVAAAATCSCCRLHCHYKCVSLLCLSCCTRALTPSIMLQSDKASAIASFGGGGECIRDFCKPLTNCCRKKLCGLLAAQCLQAAAPTSFSIVHTDSLQACLKAMKAG